MEYFSVDTGIGSASGACRRRCVTTGRIEFVVSIAGDLGCCGGGGRCRSSCQPGIDATISVVGSGTQSCCDALACLLGRRSRQLLRNAHGWRLVCNQSLGLSRFTERFSELTGHAGELTGQDCRSRRGHHRADLRNGSRRRRLGHESRIDSEHIAGHRASGDSVLRSYISMAPLELLGSVHVGLEGEASSLSHGRVRCR